MVIGGASNAMFEELRPHFLLHRVVLAPWRGQRETQVFALFEMNIEFDENRPS